MEYPGVELCFEKLFGGGGGGGREGQGGFQKSIYIANFTPKNSRQSKAPILETLQIFVRSLRQFEAKNQVPWKFHITFSCSPFEIPLRF